MRQYSILSLVCFILICCNDRLNIEPQQAISESSALADTNGIRTAVIGLYAMYANVDNLSLHPILLAEFLSNSGDIEWTNFDVAAIREVFDKNMATTNQVAEDLWINSYRVINQANTIERALTEIEPAEGLDALSAEARFVRGMVYFELIEFFAYPWSKGNPDDAGVPIVTAPAVETLQDPFIPRGTISEVYSFVLKDLMFARDHLPLQNGFYPSSYSASALLSRVYLTQGNYELALVEAERVIASDQFELIDTYDDVFNQIYNSTEDIFSIQITPDEGTNHMSYYYSGELEGGGAFLGITDHHTSKYDSNDLRGQLFYFDMQPPPTRRTSKWVPQPSFDGNVTIARLAEMYLTRAEARFRLGDLEGAAEDVNTIRARAGLESILAGDLSLDAIFDERYLELAFEGHELRDRKRTRRPIENLEYDHWSLVFPIPQREINLNPELEQNDGY